MSSPIPRYEDMYGSTYVSPEDLPAGKVIKVKIIEVEALELKCNTNGRLVKNWKVVLTGEGCKKKIAVNKTSAKRLAAAWTKEFAKWNGQYITIESGEVNSKPAVLLKPAKGAPAPAEATA